MNNSSIYARHDTMHHGDNGGGNKNRDSWLAVSSLGPDAKGFSDQSAHTHSTVTFIKNLQKIYPFKNTMHNPRVHDYLQNQLYHEIKFSY